MIVVNHTSGVLYYCSELSFHESQKFGMYVVVDSPYFRGLPECGLNLGFKGVLKRGGLSIFQECGWKFKGVLVDSPYFKGLP